MNYPPKEAWKIPELWTGKTCFIIGGGPSLKTQNLEKLKNERTIGINAAFKYYPWIDVLYFGDCGFYDLMWKEILLFGGLKITSCGRANKTWSNIYRVSRGKLKGIEVGRRNKISWNRNSGGSAINVAYWLGSRKIVLLGFDMRKNEKGEKNFHNEYLAKENQGYNPFKIYLECFEKIQEDAKILGVEILNATPNSAIKEFPMIDLDEFLTKE
jgi:hypothetical protein